MSDVNTKEFQTTNHKQTPMTAIQNSKLEEMLRLKGKGFRSFVTHECHHMTCLKWRNIKPPATMLVIRVELTNILGRNHFQLSTAMLAARK
jgi:hypothetical protein